MDESEWIEFIKEIKKSGIKKERDSRIQRKMIEFIKWKKFNSNIK